MRSGRLFISSVCALLALAGQVQSAQAPRIACTKPPSNAYDESLKSYLRAWQVYELDSAALVRPVGQDKFTSRFEIVLGNEYVWDVTLRPSQLQAATASVVLRQDSGTVYLTPMVPARLNGYLSNGPTNSEVRLTISENFIYGMIQDHDSTYFIQPLRQFVKGAPRNQFILYEKSQAILPRGAVCGTRDLVGSTSTPDIPSHKSVATTQQELLFYTAVDFSIYQWFDYSVQDIVSTYYSVLNLVEGNFDDEFNDPFWVGGLDALRFFISTCPTCDPWTNSPDANVLLADFRDWGNNTGCTENGKLAQLWTARNIFTLDNNGNQNLSVVGLAYRGETICSDYGYQVLENFTPFADALRNLVSHETGHNMNCPHDYVSPQPCVPAPPPYIMAPAINGSNTWSSGQFPAACDKNSTSIINDYYPGVDCLTLYYGAMYLIGDTWVDFATRSCIQDGSQDQPFNNLSTGIRSGEPNRTIFIRPGVSQETIRISLPCTLARDGNSGTVTIGRE